MLMHFCQYEPACLRLKPSKNKIFTTTTISNGGQGIHRFKSVVKYCIITAIKHL